MAVRDVVQAAAGVGGGGEYIEDLFSTYLYTGTGATQTITNGIDLDGEGGLVWMKSRSLDGSNNSLVNTADGVNSGLVSNSASAATATDFSSFNANGFTLGSDVQGGYNNSGATFVSWTFRKAPKFCDVLTYTGTGLNTTIAHSLGAVPGMILVKKTSAGGVAWAVYHRSLANTEYLVLNTTAASATGATRWNNTTPTSSVFSLGTDASVNASGSTYAAYVFAHDAGGFGDDGEQNVISCGSYTGTGSIPAPLVNLGWEPQWVLIKSSNPSDSYYGDWFIFDTARGIFTSGASDPRNDIIPDPFLKANTAGVEGTNRQVLKTTPTGFQLESDSSTDLNENLKTYIYIAIRRPMKTPESGTEVFMPDLSPNSNNPRFISGFPVDMAMERSRISTGVAGMDVTSRLTTGKYMRTGSTNSESGSGSLRMDYMNGFDNDGDTSPNWVAHMFKRAPGFMDVVCWTSTASTNRRINHNLTVPPELILCKSRNNAQNWAGYVAPLGINKGVVLNNTYASFNATGLWGTSAPTSTDFGMDESYYFPSGYTVVTYLFATCPGVSKVGSYTGTGADLNVDCGFSAGARFILIKRTDSTGDWYVWDSARGIVAGNDPYLLLNSAAAEVTSTDYIDPLSSGFTVTSNASSTVNVNTGTYIFFAIS
jgi:hypothetical protein